MNISSDRSQLVWQELKTIEQEALFLQKEITLLTQHLGKESEEYLQKFNGVKERLFKVLNQIEQLDKEASDVYVNDISSESFIQTITDLFRQFQALIPSKFF